MAALVLLNDPTYVEAARALAAQIMKMGGDTPAGRIRFAFRRALQRDPSEEETRILQGLYEKHLAEYQADTKAAADTQRAGILPVDKELDAIQLAAWTSVARTIMNLHESITRN